MYGRWSRQSDIFSTIIPFHSVQELRQETREAVPAHPVTGCMMSEKPGSGKNDAAEWSSRWMSSMPGRTPSIWIGCELTLRCAPDESQSDR